MGKFSSTFVPSYSAEAPGAAERTKGRRGRMHLLREGVRLFVDDIPRSSAFEACGKSCWHVNTSSNFGFGSSGGPLEIFFFSNDQILGTCSTVFPLSLDCYLAMPILTNLATSKILAYLQNGAKGPRSSNV
ncbi:hypothetical protein CDAR_203961 [Caerostris darwini]|uniref:Uncharacterized protein n=1 Tax=Caerostris darwini TaxID=1538125 RepID=A0AAV4RLU6_9ARAC|nr:hypothetical protein CDAR_203961 [Caerostris darwini]